MISNARCPLCSAPETPERAALLQQMLDALIASGAGGKRARPSTWEEIETKLRPLHSPPIGAIKTWYIYRQVLAEAAEVAPTPGDLDDSAVCEFVAQSYERRSETRTNLLTRTLSAVCTYLRRHDYLAVDPFEDGWEKYLLQEPDRQSRAFSLEDITRVLDEADRRWMEAKEAAADGWCGRLARLLAGRVRTALYLWSYCALRRQEALWLKWGDVEFDSEILRVGRNLRTKTRAARAPVPLPKPAADVLRDWSQYVCANADAWVFPKARDDGNDKPWDNGGADHEPTQMVKALAESIGIEGFTPHRLRHSWATHAGDWWGLSEEQIRAVLRHTSTRTQRQYRRAFVQNLAVIGHRVDFKIHKAG